MHGGCRRVDPRHSPDIGLDGECVHLEETLSDVRDVLETTEFPAEKIAEMCYVFTKSFVERFEEEWYGER